VTCRSTLRRTRKSFPFNSFADPHPLNPVPSTLYKNIGGRGTKFPNSFAAHAREMSRCLDLSPLEYAVADKHRVLPVFSRNRPRSSPLEATLVSPLVSVDSKWFTVNPKSLDATLTKNTGGGEYSERSTFNLQTFKRSEHPIAAKSLWCHNRQRHGISSRSGETTPLPPVSKSTRADIGDSSILVPFASRAWIQRSKAGFRVCTYKP